MKDLTQARLKELLHYDPETGIFVWLKGRGPVKKGWIAGSVQTVRGKKYIVITLHGKHYKAHRLAFLYVKGVFPPDEVDHISGDGTDNRWVNMRHATRTQNNKNHRLRDDNISGCTGVHWRNDKQKWHAYVGTKPIIHLGYFSHIFEAACARKASEIAYGYHKNHGQDRPL